MALAVCLLYLVYLPDHVLALNTKDNLEMVWCPDREHNVLKTKNINKYLVDIKPQCVIYLVWRLYLPVTDRDFVGNHFIVT